jgi:hypothetical protein
VHEDTVATEDRYALPAAVLDEQAWRDRTVMAHYPTAPGRGN